jgi:hypothetical protein
MENSQPADPQMPNNDKESAKRMLKKLRILLIIWLIAFIVTIIWFSVSPSY